MANILIARLVSAELTAVDTVTADIEIHVQEGTALTDLGVAQLTVSLKTLGLYCTAVQLNNKVLDVAEGYANDQGHTEAFTVKYLHGSFSLATIT